MRYGPVGWFVVDPKEVEERLKKGDKVPNWMVEIAKEKLESMKADEAKEVLIYNWYGVH